MPGPHTYVSKYSTKICNIRFYRIFKGESSLEIFERHANLKYKYGNRRFWCKGYYVDTVGRNEKVIKKYIQEQLQEDRISDQLVLKELVDPFNK